MKLKILNNTFSICQVDSLNNINLDKDFLFVGKTNEEISIVCDSNDIPDNSIKADNNWKCIKIDGILDFSLIGILSKISTILADNNIGIFVVSTYNTDYILVRKQNIELARKCLEENNYIFI